MRNNTSVKYNVSLLIGDAIALIAGLVLAYVLRVSIDHSVVSTVVSSKEYLTFILVLLPFWLLIFALFGLYNENYYQNRFVEFGRVAIGVFVGILFAIGYSYMVNTPIFPARLVVVYGFIFSLITVVGSRTFLRGYQKRLFSYGKGLNDVLIVGDNKASVDLLKSLGDSSVSGYRVVGVVGGTRHKIKGYEDLPKFTSFTEAIAKLKLKQLQTIIQTELYPEGAKNDEILNFAQSNHVAYRFVPGNSELFVGNIKVDLFQSTPIIAVHQTALIGWGKVVKRLTDVILGGILMILASPLILVIFIVQKLNNPRAEVFYSVYRLSRFGSKVKIYKFRTLKTSYTNMTPEDGFAKMGRPDLLKQYRNNGDQLENDPRISTLGRFLRKYSLDELPQLFNVIRGDISLVGPRALDPIELENYDKKNLILAVKTGLTGLAQISGRREISFDERRKLDLYYVQNWSFWGDITIIIKTISVVLFHKGAS